MPKLVAMLRVKDGIAFAQEWLKRHENIVDEIVALDNGSTDGTFEILQSHPKIVDLVRTEGYNEGRDKNMLLAMMAKRQPDWCIWLDIDEIFEPQLTRADFDRLMNRKFVNKYAFRRFHLIDTEHFAGSGDYFEWTATHDRIMWRHHPGGYFEDLVLNSPNIKGIGGVKINTNFRLRHLGYVSKKEVDKKVGIYKALIDPKEYSDLNRMYIANEKKLKWHDDRNSPAVKAMNFRLNCMQFIGLFPKAKNKILRKLKSSNQSAQAQTT